MVLLSLIKPEAGSTRIEQWPLLLVLTCAGCLGGAVGGIVAPVMPEVVEHLEISSRWAGLLISIHCLTLALFSPLMGILADRLGKSKVLAFSLILYGISGSAGAWMTHFETLMVSRAVVGVGSAGITAAILGILTNRYDGQARSRLIGYGASILGISNVIFSLLGGWLGSFHWQFAFYGYGLALPIAFGTVLIVKDQPRSGVAIIDLNHHQQLSQNLRQSSTLAFMLALAITSGVFYTVVVYGPLHFKATIEADSLLNGIILALRALGVIMMSALGASRLAQYLGVVPAIVLGYGLVTVTLTTIPILQQPGLILLSALGFGLGAGIALPNLYDALASTSLPEVRSTVLAIGNGMAYLGRFASPLCLGSLWESTGAGVFYWGGSIVLVTGVLLLMQHKTVQPNRS